MRQETTTTFLEEFHECLNALRGSLADVLSAAGTLNARPQEIAREFKLNKNLAWKVAKLVHSPQDKDALGFIPGSSGFQIFLQAMGKAGIGKEILNAAEDAFRDFQGMVQRHAGDRPTLQLLLDSAALGSGDANRLEESRRLAFQGNSGVLGIQASVKLSSFYFAPNPDDPEQLDFAAVSGLFGLRRFRPDAKWVLLRHSKQDGEGRDVAVPQRIPLDPRFSGPGPSLLGNFTTSPALEVTVRTIGNVEFFELAEGPIGNTGVGDVCFGYFNLKDVPRFRGEENQDGRLHVFLASPVETLVFDLFLHKDMDIPEMPSAEMALDFHHVGGTAYQDAIPLPSQPRQLLGTSPSVATPLIKDYNRMTDLVWNRLGWNPKDFRAWRIEVKFPPIPGTLTMSFPLEERPD